MSEIQLNSRTTSLSYNESERENVNQLLAEFQRANGTKETFKELFVAILQKACASAAPSEPVTIEKVPEDIQKLISHIRTEGPNELPEDIHSDFSIIENIWKENVLNKNVMSTMQGEINTLKDELAFANQEPPAPNEPEPVEDSPNSISFELSDDQLTIARTIQRNRHHKMIEQGNTREAEPLPEMIRSCFFNKANLFNWGGNWFTGL